MSCYKRLRNNQVTTILTHAEITRRLFVEHNMYVKHCQEKTILDSDLYLRIASRTQTENRNLAAALVDIIGKK